MELLKYIFVESGIKMTDRSVNYYSTLFDDDKNEHITKEEFILVLMKHNAPIIKT